MLSKQKKEQPHESRPIDKSAVSTDTPESLFALGVSNMKLAEYDKAVVAFQKALAIDPEFFDARYNLSIVYALKGDLDRSISSFEELVAGQPTNASAYYNIACLYARQNQTEQATEWLKKAIDRGYDNWEHLKADPDMQTIRHTMYFKNLVKQHIP